MSTKAFDFQFMEHDHPLVSFKFYITDSQPFLSCISCEFGSAEALVNEWEQIQNFVSVYYQPKSENERWNIYLLLICPDEVEVKDRYIIQNDTYTARKIVIQKEPVPVDISRSLSIVNNELLGLDLKYNFRDSAVECNYQSTLSDMLEGIPLDSSADARAIRVEKIKSLLNFIGQE